MLVDRLESLVIHSSNSTSALDDMESDSDDPYELEPDSDYDDDSGAGSQSLSGKNTLLWVKS